MEKTIRSSRLVRVVAAGALAASLGLGAVSSAHAQEGTGTGFCADINSQGFFSNAAANGGYFNLPGASVANLVTLANQASVNLGLGVTYTSSPDFKHSNLRADLNGGSSVSQELTAELNVLLTPALGNAVYGTRTTTIQYDLTNHIAISAELDYLSGNGENDTTNCKVTTGGTTPPVTTPTPRAWQR